MIDSFDSNTDRNRERCFQRIRDTTRARTTGSEARTQRNPPFYYDWPARRLFLARVLNHHHPTILKHDFRFYYVVHVCVCLFIYRSVLYSMNCGHPIGSNKTKQRNLEPRTKYVCETARRVTTQDTRIPNRYHDTTQHQQKRTNERTNERTMRGSLESFKQASNNAISKAQLMVGLNKDDDDNGNAATPDIELSNRGSDSGDGEGRTASFRNLFSGGGGGGVEEDPSLDNSERSSSVVASAADLLCPELTFQQRLIGFATCFTIACE